MLVGHHSQDSLTITIDGLVELGSLSRTWGKHHDTGGFEVIFVLDVLHVSLATIRLFHDCFLQLLCEVVERVAHILHHRCLIKPFLHLGRVLLHLIREVTIDGCILCRRVGGGTIEALFHNRESIEHLGGDVQSQHCHQDDIHQVDHLLAW